MRDSGLEKDAMHLALSGAVERSGHLPVPNPESSLDYPRKGEFLCLEALSDTQALL